MEETVIYFSWGHPGMIPLLSFSLRMAFRLTELVYVLHTDIPQQFFESELQLITNTENEHENKYHLEQDNLKQGLVLC